MTVRARTVRGFCQAYGIGRNMVYELLRAGKLRAVKMGARTLILEDSAQEWLGSLPPSVPTFRAMIGADGGGQKRTGGRRKALTGNENRYGSGQTRIVS